MIDVSLDKESTNENQQVSKDKVLMDNSRRQHGCNDDNDEDDEDDDDDNDNDNPADSSAARCIHFIINQHKNCTENNILDEIEQQQDQNVLKSSSSNNDSIVVFRPVYTHQVFTSEYIPGYVPEGFLTIELPNIDLDSDNNNDNTVCNDTMKLGSNATDCDDDSTKENTTQQQQQQQQQQQHSSFFVQMKTLMNNHTIAIQNNYTNTTNTLEQSILQQLQELNICIELAPSCKVCTVKINPITVFPPVGTQQKRLSLSDLIDTSTTTSMKSDDDVVDNNNSNDSSVQNSENSHIDICGKKRTNTIDNSYLSNTDIESHKRQKIVLVPADDNSVDLRSVDDDDDEEDGKSNNDDEDVPSSVPLTINEIKTKLSTALPPIVDTINEQDMFLLQPIGTIVHKYSHSKKDFIITIANATESSCYHNSVQKLARWYIETADDVEILPLKTAPTTAGANNTQTNNNKAIQNNIESEKEDEDDGYWKVVYLFERIQVSKEVPCQLCYQFVGYVTLYHIENKCREPIPGMTMRICQALILPHYQRCGHGRILLHTIFNIVSTPTITNKHVNDSCIQSNDIDNSTGSSDRIVEINVEDPAPGFTQMRNLIDYERFSTMLRTIDHDRNNNVTVDLINILAVEFLQRLKKRKVTDPDYFQPLSKEIALQLTTATLTDIDQVYIAYEIYILNEVSTFLDNNHQGSLSSNLQQHKHQQQQLVPKSNSTTGSCLKEDLEKGYRLMIKQRLNKEHQERIKRKCQTKQEAKDMLQKMFEKVYNEYMAIVNKKK